ncbi:MAG TPA: sigma-54 dependent transcriptional regulator [Kofleriaceae bacterium]|jgi:two-component system response regulator HydG
MTASDPIKILIIDDDRAVIDAIRTVVTRRLDGETVELETAPDGVTIAHRLEGGQAPWDVVLLDVDLPGISGPKLLDQFRESGSTSSVIMLSADASANTAASCMRAGAFYYLTKPFKAAELVDSVLSATRHSRMRRKLFQPPDTDASATIVGSSPGMRQLRAAIARVAEQNVSILIQGESGTGKELVARLVHAGGVRRNRPFVAVNCGAIPETLIDSELFGHQKGAFTGATMDRPGVFVEADGGTLFLDEIGDMPLAVQARLLRVLQEGEVRPVGSNGVRDVDVRVIAATHVDLDQAAERGKFRKDLFYRLNVVVLEIPPLRERREDLPELCARFLTKHGGDANMSLSPTALDAFTNYNWPGNVRELENAIHSAIALRSGNVIGAESLPASMRTRIHGSRPIPLPQPNGDEQLTLTEAKKLVSTQFEHDYLQQIMQRAQGSVAEAARLAGLDRTNFRRLLQRHNIDPTTFK